MPWAYRVRGLMGTRDLPIHKRWGGYFLGLYTEMLSAYAEGRDLHTLTARNLTGRTEVSKDDRKLAKAVNFGLLYGMGHKGFSLTP